MQSPAESIRGFLLLEVQRFVEHARNIKGVRQIALIGSLATAKQNPKDADLLVAIDDQAELASLAAAGRRLKGRAQSRNRGADIFLVNLAGTYLGRICQWRDCRPGIRMACRARHCGQRKYVCDDLDVLTLPAAVVNTPPLELCPAVVHRAQVPDDVQDLINATTSSQSTDDDGSKAGN